MSKKQTVLEHRSGRVERRKTGKAQGSGSKQKQLSNKQTEAAADSAESAVLTIFTDQQQQQQASSIHFSSLPPSSHSPL